MGHLNMPREMTLTKEQAQLIVDTHELDVLMDNDEEVDLLEQHNPELLDAYRVLIDIAES